MSPVSDYVFRNQFSLVVIRYDVRSVLYINDFIVITVQCTLSSQVYHLGEIKIKIILEYRKSVIKYCAWGRGITYRESIKEKMKIIKHRRRREGRNRERENRNRNLIFHRKYRFE